MIVWTGMIPHGVYAMLCLAMYVLPMIIQHLNGLTSSGELFWLSHPPARTSDSAHHHPSVLLHSVESSWSVQCNRCLSLLSLAPNQPHAGPRSISHHDPSDWSHHIHPPQSPSQRRTDHSIKHPRSRISTGTAQASA